MSGWKQKENEPSKHLGHCFSCLSVSFFFFFGLRSLSPPHTHIHTYTYTHTHTPCLSLLTVAQLRLLFQPLSQSRSLLLSQRNREKERERTTADVVMAINCIVFGSMLRCLLSTYLFFCGKVVEPRGCSGRRRAEHTEQAQQPRHGWQPACRHCL